MIHGRPPPLWQQHKRTQRSEHTGTATPPKVDIHTHTHLREVPGLEASPPAEGAPAARGTPRLGAGRPAAVAGSRT